MKLSSTVCRSYKEAAHRTQGFRSAVSFHNHTLHSMESIGFLFLLSERSPLLSRLIEKRIIDHWHETGEIIDFNRVHWTPPILPWALHHQETQQIQNCLQTKAFVSITDHDCIDGCLELEEQGLDPRAPISLEWTVPYGRGCFHVGVHNLPRHQANVWVREFHLYTARPNRRLLLEILTGLDTVPDTLLVLNHPFWDIANIGQKCHQRYLKNFWSRYGCWIHALELNGFRSRPENNKVLSLGKALDVPVVSGGDRHGWQASSVLNVSRSETFEDFVREIRVDRRSTIVTMPVHQESLLARTIETVGEAIRPYPRSYGNPRLWTDRVFIETDCDGKQPLSAYWRSGGPWWLRTAMSLVRIIGSPQMRPALRWALAGKDSTL